MAPETTKLQLNPAAISLRDAARLLTKVGSQPVTEEMLYPDLAQLAVPMGDRGCLSLFGDRAEQHRLFAEHLTAEYRVKTEGRGRTVDEWKQRPERADNHWLDGVVGCAVAASIQGAVLAGTESRPRPKERLTLSELQRKARGGR